MEAPERWSFIMVNPFYLNRRDLLKKAVRSGQLKLQMGMGLGVP
jgi:hypothetical protein